MNMLRDAANGGALRGWIIRVVLFAFALRAFIPAGYMPDFDAVGNGMFKVVICSAYGAKTIAVDTNGNKVPGPSHSTHDQPCAFGGVTVAAIPTLAMAVLEAPEFIGEAVHPRTTIVLPPARAGPPLGSRGPPQIS
jgi:hypothetical protein